MKPPDLLSTDQCAALAGVTRPTVIKAIDDGVLPAARVGRAWVITRADALRFKADRAAERLAAEKTRTARERAVVADFKVRKS